MTEGLRYKECLKLFKESLEGGSEFDFFAFGIVALKFCHD